MKLFLYFSGTGNTKYIAYKFSEMIEYSNIKSIEDNNDYRQLIEAADEITICYPIYTSMMPRIVSDFLNKYKEHFRNKTVNTIITQMMFSGDGAAIALRFLKGVNITTKYSIHISMLNNISDVKFLTIAKEDKVMKVIKKNNDKILNYISKINRGVKIKHGRRIYSRLIGYVLQRSYGPWFHNKHKKKWQVEATCILCNKCVKDCPVDNLFLKGKRINSKDKCILCYRCVNICPKKSIHIIGKNTPKDQYFLS